MLQAVASTASGQSSVTANGVLGDGYHLSPLLPLVGRMKAPTVYLEDGT